MKTEQLKYNCLVVDDEPIARQIVINYIRKLPILDLADESMNALHAIDSLRMNNNIDIIFLDINMPHLSGLDLVKIIQPQQPVIFTTAYSEYAVESYDLNAVDYLLKPFSFERFTKAVYKAVDTIKKSQLPVFINSDEKKPPFFIKSDGKNYPVSIDDILYCEAMKNYTMVRLKDGQKLMPLMPLFRCEELLAEAGGDFVQVHRSFLISKKHITAVGANQVSIDKYEIPIGIQFKEKFLRTIGMKDSG
jgi:DNA-binding LytR/AlgR family response regulator